MIPGESIKKLYRKAVIPARILLFIVGKDYMQRLSSIYTEKLKNIKRFFSFFYKLFVS